MPLLGNGARSGRKRSPQSRDDDGVSWVFPSCGLTSCAVCITCPRPVLPAAAGIGGHDLSPFLGHQSAVTMVPPRPHLPSGSPQSTVICTGVGSPPFWGGGFLPHSLRRGSIQGGSSDIIWRPRGAQGERARGAGGGLACRPILPAPSGYSLGFAG